MDEVVVPTKSAVVSTKSGGTTRKAGGAEYEPLLAQMPGNQSYHMGIQNINNNDNRNNDPN